jgi:putative transposase
VHLRYAQHVNWARGLTGRLWQGRFFSCGLDDAHLLSAVRYVERNPVRAGLAERAQDYPWSSAAAHCGLARKPWLADASELAAQVGEWSAWLRTEEDDVTVAALRRHTTTGRPLGSAAFLNLLEAVLGRPVRSRKAGRSRKSAQGT